MQSVVARVVAAVLLTGSAALGAALAWPAAPATAAYCTLAGGVSVLVDFGELGGGTDQRCGSGDVASAAFSSAGYVLGQRQAGELCRVDGKPAQGECWGTDSYWGFFVSDDGGAWIYASEGVYSHPVDPGDSVALVWQSSTSRRQPPARPATPVAAAPTATAAPTRRPSRKPSAKATVQPSAKASARTTATPTPTASVTPAVPTTGSPTGTPTGSPSATAAATGSPTAGVPAATATESETSEEPADLDAAPVAATDDDGGLPGWVPPVLVVALLGAVGGITLVRRRGA